MECLQKLCLEHGHESEEKSMRIMSALDMMEGSEKKEKMMEIGLKLMDGELAERIRESLSLGESG